VDASTLTNPDFYGHPYDLTVAAGSWYTVGTHGYSGFSINPGDGTHYGWIELTRGSLTIGQMGYQDVAGVAAVIPGGAVPEPGTLGLGAIGLFAVFAQRRRRRSKKSSRA